MICNSDPGCPIGVNTRKMALARRNPQAGLLHHEGFVAVLIGVKDTSTSEGYLVLLQRLDIAVNMSSRADYYNDVVAEVFFP
jgi:hypothetical protein